MRLRYVVSYTYGDRVISPTVDCDDWRYNDQAHMHIFLRRQNQYQPSDSDDIIFSVSERVFISAELVEEENADQ